MKKKILLFVFTLILALTLTFALASCHLSETNEPTEAPAGEPTEEPTSEPTEAPTSDSTEAPTDTIVDNCTHEYENSCDAECNLCGETRTAPHTQATLEEKAATCTETGLTKGIYCSVCNEVITAQQTVPAKGHIEVIDPEKAASCSEEGLTEGSHCDVCGEIIVAQKTIEKTEHRGGLIVPSVMPSCTETGLSQGEKCLICKEFTVEQEVLEKLPHTEVIIPAQAATCTADGCTEGKKCSACGEILEKSVVVGALGHNFPDKYSFDKDQHWKTCNRKGCSVTIERAVHNVNKYNCTSCDYYNGPAVYDMTEAPSKYKPTSKAFDLLEVAYNKVAAGTMDVKVEDVSEVSMPFGEGIKIAGWIAFSTPDIEGFGYWFNDDVYNVQIREIFSVETDGDVLAVGGPNARRFSISANTNVAEDITSVSFVVKFKDGTYIVLKRLDVVMGKIETGEIPSDDEIVTAEPEIFNGGVTLDVDETGESTYTANTSTGLSYIAAGAAFTNGKFTIESSGLVINFEENYDRFASDFNKYKISYSSSTPLKAIVTYTDGDKSVTDTVYLEKGNNMLFSCLTLGYVEGVYAKNITSIQIEVLGSLGISKFALYDVTTEKVDTISSNVTYLVNQRYVLGINVLWGGGISYIMDKEDNNVNIGNLINCADAGRLVQQSYYGTNNPSEYTLGEFHGNAWGYNPVQGGNKYNEPSRIIDIQIEEMSIYIKAQPKDWAQHDLTRSYMENVYTVYSDRIQVDNRFVDFAGFKYNPNRAQELPAFYTIGFLNTFVYYDGTNPWAGEDLTKDGDLEFWSDNLDSNKFLDDANTETWCAWMNDASDYGIGLYTPNVSAFLAGRSDYEESPDEMDASAQACSYVAAIDNFKIVSYEAIEYSYLITTGSTQEIRDLFTEHKDFADNADLTD